jgi:hypothetical protein
MSDDRRTALKVNADRWISSRVDVTIRVMGTIGCGTAVGRQTNDALHFAPILVAGDVRFGSLPSDSVVPRNDQRADDTSADDDRRYL